jgi:hypothetical protein
MQPKRSAQAIADAMASFDKRTDERERAWRNRLKIHPNDLADPERTANLAQRLGSKGRLASFKKLLHAYDNQPSAENYLRLRQKFPELEIEGAGCLGGFDPLLALVPEFEKHGIDPGLIAGVLDLSEPDIDALALQLIERLVAKRSIPKNRPGHIDERRNAIPEAMVDYLIVTMLEPMQYGGQLTTIPFSLVVLIRDRLCGPAPDLDKAYRSKKRQSHAVFVTIADAISSRQPISLRSFAVLSSISKTTAARWFKDPKFRRMLERVRSKDFQQIIDQAEAKEKAGVGDPEMFLKIVQRHFAEAKNETALHGAWKAHVEPVETLLFPSDYSECVNMLERRKLEIAAEYAGAHSTPALWFWSLQAQSIAASC